MTEPVAKAGEPALESPVLFIFGSPRSGTTWMGKSLDSHPGVDYLHEPEISHPTRLPQFPEDGPENIRLARADLARWRATRDLRSRGSRPVFRKEGMGSLYHGARVAGIYAAKALERVFPGFAKAEVVLPAFRRAPALQVIKTVNMLGRAGLFMKISPDVRGVHLIRHPCGQIASMLRGIATYGEQEELTYKDLVYSPLGVEEGLTLERLAVMPPVERLAWKWVAFNDAACRALSHEKRAITVSYESLTAAPDQEFPTLLKAVGLDWHDDVASFVRNSIGGSGNASHYSLRRDPQAAARRWKKELSGTEISVILDICGKSEVGRSFFTDLG